VCGLLAAYGEIKTTHGYCPGYFAVDFKAAASSGMVNGVIDISRGEFTFIVYCTTTTTLRR